MITVKQALERLREHSKYADLKNSTHGQGIWMSPNQCKEVLDCLEPFFTNASTELDVFIFSVKAEYYRVLGLFPGDNLNSMALSEEYGELVKALMDESWVSVYKEAVQTAAMCARVTIQGDRSLDAWRLGKGLDVGGEPLPSCDHDWVDGRNAIIKSGEFCRKCHAVRAGNHDD